MEAVDFVRSRTLKRKTEAPRRCLALPVSQLQALAPEVLHKVAWLVLYKMLSTSANRESAEVVCDTHYANDEQRANYHGR
jgi:hypothetical protein